MRNPRSLFWTCCRIIIGAAFWIASKLLYSVKINGLEYDTRVSRTYLAIAHKRNMDPIVMIPALLSHRGWPGWAGDIHFGLRSDAFSTGYLAHLLPHPEWLSHLLHPISIGSILRGLGAHPLEHLHIRPVEEWMRELVQIEGDVRRLAVGYLAYTEHHGLVRRVKYHTWLPKVSEAVIHVGPGKVGYDQMPLTYAWNDLQGMLSPEPLTQSQSM